MVFMLLTFWENMSFRKNQPPMRPQAKPPCRKWPHIDPLYMSFSSKSWLWPCFYNVYSTFSWKITFSFGAIWGVFIKDLGPPRRHPGGTQEAPRRHHGHPGGTQGTQEARLGSEIKVCQNICVFFSESGATRHLARGLEGWPSPFTMSVHKSCPAMFFRNPATTTALVDRRNPYSLELFGESMSKRLKTKS